MDIFQEGAFPITIQVHKIGPDEFHAVMNTSLDDEKSPPVRGRSAAEALGRMVKVIMELQMMGEALSELIHMPPMSEN